MANTFLIVTEEGLKRVFAGLGELPAKVSHEIIKDFDAQVAMAKDDLKSFIALVEKHLQPHKDAVEAEVAKIKAAADAEAARLAAIPKVVEAAL